MNFVYALDAATGQPIASFGKDGRIDLREDLGRDPAEQSIYLTTPAVIYKDLMIVGGRESETLPASPGDIRAYDVRSGKLRWSFHTIPHPGEFGEDTWPKGAWKTSGAANNWAGHDRRCHARHRVCSHRFGGFRFLRSRPSGRRSVRQHSARAERRNRRTHLAFSGREARSCGTAIFPRRPCS